MFPNDPFWGHYFLNIHHDLHKAIEYSSTFHFVDVTGLLSIQKSIKTINRKLNYDLKQLSIQLNANKIALNAAKTEAILFKTKSKNLDTNLNNL